ncbi:MAG: hypothetical protein ABFC31_00050 [Clostridiaceae bacterium]
MSGNSGRKKPNVNHYQTSKPSLPQIAKPLVASADASLLDFMEDGREYESLVAASASGFSFQIHADIKRTLDEISVIRNHPVICYISNVINKNITASTSIDHNDETPFMEMLNNIPQEYKEIDIVLVTPGGLAEVVARLVDMTRKRFDKVGFILPFMAMSAGTIFCLSGDELIMSESACIGPIDPQVFSPKAGRFVPAKSVLTLINAIEERSQKQIENGEKPLWTDMALIQNIDVKEIGSALAASQLSIDLVKKYLAEFKFRSWTKHGSDGRPVTDNERRERAGKIAEKLCDHSFWLSHSREITREMARDDCRLEIVYPESIDGLARAIRRFWAFACFSFEHTPICKIFASKWYTMFMQDVKMLNGGK